MTFTFDGQKKRFDITIPLADYLDWETLFKKLTGWCTHFAFQHEKGESGYEHWQVRCNLIHKKTAAGMITEVIR